jgi:DNA-binding NarL/FixJ family response regulator
MLTSMESDFWKPLVELRHAIKEADATARELRERRLAIVQALRDHGFTLQEIADGVGVARQTVHQWTRM